MGSATSVDAAHSNIFFRHTRGVKKKITGQKIVVVVKPSASPQLGATLINCQESGLIDQRVTRLELAAGAPSTTHLPPTPESCASLSNGQSLNYRKVVVHECEGDFLEEEVSACSGLTKFLNLRAKYQFLAPETEFHNSLAQQDEAARRRKLNSPQRLVLENGVYHVYTDRNEEELSAIPSIREFHKDLRMLWEFCCNGPAASFSSKRLKILEKLYELHVLMNSDLERENMKNGPVDFFRIHKVDNHIHAAAMMTGAHLLRFIRKKIDDESEIIKLSGRDGEHVVTVKQFVQDEVGLSGEFLNLDSLNVQGDETVFERFDNFNARYNPFGKGSLRDLFLKSDGPSNGKFFAEILREVIDQTRTQGSNVLLEPRLSIYGKSQNEWDILAKWMVSLDKISTTSLFNARTKWLIQFPRIFRFMVGKSVKNFEEYLSNLFKPLFEVSMSPSSHPELAKLLEHVVGFDSVDDESPFDELLESAQTAPLQCTSGTPPYSYFAYYTWANIYSLNQLRRMNGLPTFSFRPHAGEAGQVHHLATAFLLADGINHGIMLRSNHTLTYLYYLAQIGMSVSPLSNNALFLPFHKNPFRTFHAIGLNVTLSTDDPLQFHNTAEPLIEEYTIAGKVFKLSSVDLAEIAARSVRQSGWSHEDKCRMLGPSYNEPGVQGNDYAKTNIPACRSEFRHISFRNERRIIWNACNGQSRNFQEQNIHPDTSPK